MDNSKSSSTPNLKTVRQFAERHPPFSEPSLRFLIFNAESRVNSRGEEIEGNGLASAIVRLGRKVLIDEDKFFEWVEQHRCGQSESSNEERRAA